MIMNQSLSKADLMWLSYNTEICNHCESVDDCLSQDVLLRVYRPHHQAKLHQIFQSFQTKDMKDQQNNRYVQINNFKISDLYELMRENGGDMFLNTSNGKTYFVAVDKRKYHRIFNRAPVKMLANLPPAKKINILKSLSQQCYTCAKSRDESQKALSKKTNKILALLQIPIPRRFMENELRKVRLIAAEIAQISNIKPMLENFRKLPIKKQKELLIKVCAITAKYNRIEMPNVQFLSARQMQQDEGIADWVQAEAFSYENNVCINTGSLKKLDGVQSLSLAWHETTHIAQATGDYSQYPLVEEMFNQSLDFLEKMPETYIFHPQEKIVYALEKHFIEKVVQNAKLLTNASTFDYTPEYDITTQYTQRSLHPRI